jgi:hypothetical protein
MRLIPIAIPLKTELLIKRIKLMAVIKNHAIQCLFATVVDLVVSSSPMAMPSVAGDRASVYRHHQPIAKWVYFLVVFMVALDGLA